MRCEILAKKRHPKPLHLKKWSKNTSVMDIFLWTSFRVGWRPKVCILANSLWSSLPNSRKSQVENQRKRPLGWRGTWWRWMIHNRNWIPRFCGQNWIPWKNLFFITTENTTKPKPFRCDDLHKLSEETLIQRYWNLSIYSFCAPCFDAMSCWPLDGFFGSPFVVRGNQPWRWFSAWRPWHATFHYKIPEVKTSVDSHLPTKKAMGWKLKDLKVHQGWWWFFLGLSVCVFFF